MWNSKSIQGVFIVNESYNKHPEHLYAFFFEEERIFNSL